MMRRKGPAEPLADAIEYGKLEKERHHPRNRWRERAEAA